MDSMNKPDPTSPEKEQDKEPSDDLQTKVREQLEIMEAVIIQLAEEEEEINRQRGGLELEIRQHYEKVLQALNECRDQCLTSVVEMAGQLTDKLHADHQAAYSLLKPLQALARYGGGRPRITDPSTDTPSALLSDAVRRHYVRQVSASSPQHPHRLFSYRRSDDTADLAHSLRHIVGTVVLTAGDGPDRRCSGSGSCEAGTSPKVGELVKATAAVSAATECVHKSVREEGVSTRDQNLWSTAEEGELCGSHHRQHSGLLTLQQQLRAIGVKLGKELSKLRQEDNSSAVAVTRGRPRVGSDLDFPQTDLSSMLLLLNSLHRDVVAVRNDMATAQTDIRQLRSNVIEVSDMTDATTEMNKLYKEMHFVKTEIHKLQKGANVVSEVVEREHRRIYIGKHQIHDLQKVFADIKTDTENIRKGAAATSEATENLQNKVTDALTDIGNVQKRVTDFSTDIGNLQKRVTDSATDIADLQKSVKDASSDIGNLQKRMTDTSAAKENLQKSVTDASTYIRNLQRSVTETSINTDHLQKKTIDPSTNIGNIQKSVMTVATTGIGHIQKRETSAATDIKSLQKDMTSTSQQTEHFHKL